MPAEKRTQFEIGGIPITVRYADVKHLRVSVRPPHGDVRVSAPRRTPEAEVIAFLTSRLDWLQKNRAKLTRPVEDGVRVWGRLVPLHLTIAPGRADARLDHDGLHIRVSTADATEDAVLAWRKRTLQHALPGLIDHWQQRIGVRASALTVRHMTSRWGTCNRRTGRLTFSTELTTKRIELVEYVVVHELAHLIAPNHGREFQAVMTHHLPAWRDHRRELNER